MYFSKREHAEKYVDELNESNILLADVTIHAYWGIQFRTYAYKNNEIKEKHIEEMKLKGWVNNNSKENQCIYGDYSDNPIWVKVNQFKKFEEVKQSDYI